MPIYEYECPKCGRFEVIQKVSDRPLKSKPGCNFPDCPNVARRLISACSFELKGSGWYKTDYASTAAGARNGPSKKPAVKETPTTSESSTTSDSTGSPTESTTSVKPAAS